MKKTITIILVAFFVLSCAYSSLSDLAKSINKVVNTTKQLKDDIKNLKDEPETSKKPTVNSKKNLKIEKGAVISELELPMYEPQIVKKTEDIYGEKIKSEAVISFQELSRPNESGDDSYIEMTATFFMETTDGIVNECGFNFYNIYDRVHSDLSLSTTSVVKIDEKIFDYISGGQDRFPAPLKNGLRCEHFYCTLSIGKINEEIDKLLSCSSLALQFYNDSKVGKVVKVSPEGLQTIKDMLGTAKFQKGF